MVTGLCSGSASAPNPSEISRLKAEAVSTKHVLTHLPKNPYCESCRLAKAKRTHRRDKKNRADPSVPPEHFGAQCTADQVFSATNVSQGVGGQKHAVMIYELATRWRTFVPSCGKDATTALSGLLKHGSPKTGTCKFHCDNAQELHKAATNMSWALDSSVPSVSGSKGAIERQGVGYDGDYGKG